MRDQAPEIIVVEMYPPADLSATSLAWAEKLLHERGVKLDVVVGPHTLIEANLAWLDQEIMRRDAAQRKDGNIINYNTYVNFTFNSFPDELAADPHAWAAIGMLGRVEKDRSWTPLKTVKVISRPWREGR